MKAKAILLASALLVGCQATYNSGSQQQALSLTGGAQHLASGQNDQRTDATYQPLWTMIRDGLTINIPENSRIQQQKQFYLSKKSYLHDVLARSTPYMYWIIDQVKQRHMPIELVLLPIVESAFNPHAKSVASAAGIWQIIPSTATRYGLKQTRGYDGRLDIASSTTTALDILQKLNTLFDGDWLLTIAAYNSGEGRILNAIKANKARGKPTDYWSLDLPKETELYVPRLLAISDIFKHHQRYGLKLPAASTSNALVQVPLNAPVDLDQIVQMIGISADKFKAYNAGVKGSIYGLSGPQHVMVPNKYASQLQLALNNGDFTPVSQAMLASNRARIQRGATRQQRGGSQHYKVRKGDTLSGIAARLGVTARNLQSWNRLRHNNLKIGQTLLVKAPALQRSKTRRPVTNSITYKVRKGDSLYSIAKRHGVDTNDLKRWNPGSSTLHPGDLLTLYLTRQQPMPDS